jgi:hypothetical protein
MNSQGSISFIQEKRAVDMVALHLSQVPGVAVEKDPSSASQFDLLVRLSSKPSDWNNVVAVEVKATEDFPTNKRRLTFSPAIRGAIVASRSPICLFVSDVLFNLIYWCWLKKPKGGELKNQRLSNLPLIKSTPASLKLMFDEARSYYQAHATR